MEAVIFHTATGPIKAEAVFRHPVATNAYAVMRSFKTTCCTQKDIRDAHTCSKLACVIKMSRKMLVYFDYLLGSGLNQGTFILLAATSGGIKFICIINAHINESGYSLFLVMSPAYSTSEHAEKNECLRVRVKHSACVPQISIAHLHLTCD